MTNALLILYLIGLYIRPQDWVALVQGFPIDYVVYGLLLLAMPLRMNRLTELSRSPHFRLMALWLVIIVASNVIHFDTWWARTAFVYYLKLVIVYISLYTFIDNIRQFKLFVWVQIILSVVLAIQCIDLIANGVGWAGQLPGWDDGHGGRARWVGLWDGMNVLCLLFVVAFPFLIQFAWGPWSFMTKVLALGSMVVILQGILLTQSRGGFLALGVVFATTLMFRIPFRRALALCLLMFAGAIVASPARMLEFDDRQGSKSGSNRVVMWQAGLDMFKSNPVLGVGKMQFRDHAREMTGKNLIAHNSYVENMAETGAIGLFVYIALSYLPIRALWRLSRTTEDPRIKNLSTALLVSICSYAAASMFITTDFDLFYVQLGLAASFLSLTKQEMTWTGTDFKLVGAAALGFAVLLDLFARFYW